MSLAITSVVIAGLAVVVTMRLTTALIADRGGVRWSDLPFLSFVLLALVYLELSPSIAMVTRSLPRIALRQEHYVRLQLLLFVGFVPPLVFSYAWGRRREPTTARPPNPRDLLRFPWEASLVVCAVLRLVIAWRYGLWRLRIGDDVAEKTGATPFAIYSLLRLLVEAQLPLVAASAFRLTRLKGTRFRASFVFFVLVQLLFALLNSRFSILYIAVAAGMGFAIGARPLIRLDRRVRRVAVAAFLTTYALGLAVLQLRASGGDRSVSTGSFNVVADNQGLNRFNCIDLSAQLAQFQRAPAGPTVWEGQLWNAKRFVDQPGFQRFRESLATTAKTKLILRYLGQRQTDYYSCMVTDGYGALGLLGVIGLGAFCGTALRLARRLIEDPALTMVFAGIWLTWQVLVFEQEAGALLFGWPLRLPILVALVASARRMKPTRPVLSLQKPADPAAVMSDREGAPS